MYLLLSISRSGYPCFLRSKVGFSVVNCVLAARPSTHHLLTMAFSSFPNCACTGSITFSYHMNICQALFSQTLEAGDICLAQFATDNYHVVFLKVLSKGSHILHNPPVNSRQPISQRVLAKLKLR